MCASTGTLTFGKPRCLGVELAAGRVVSRRQLLQLIAAAESGSEHPIAKSLVAYAESALQRENEAGFDDELSVEQKETATAGQATVTLAVEGMMCGNCEKKVRGALEDVKGVHSAVVDWEAGTAIVTGTAAVPVMIDAVEDTGKDCAELRTCTLAVEGMMCGNCEKKVRGALEDVKGVHSAVVDWEAGTAVVVSTVPAAVLADTVEDTGKDASVQSDVPYTESSTLVSQISELVTDSVRPFWSFTLSPIRMLILI
eukprot:COSAG05_NODE_93_length_19581_cov_53.686685_8_plen_255_part_00